MIELDLSRGYLSPSTKKEIETIVRGFLLDCKEEIKLTFPLNMREIARWAGVKDFVYADLGPNRLAMYNVKNKTIYLDFKLKDTPLRENFTIAHEILHIVLHINTSDLKLEGPQVFFKEKNKNKIREKEADYGAAALLMPEKTVRFLWERMTGSPDPLSIPTDYTQPISQTTKDKYGQYTKVKNEMVKTFKVSNSAMKFRLMNLSLLQIENAFEEFLYWRV